MTQPLSNAVAQGIQVAYATIRSHPLRSSWAALAMTAAVATTAVVQTSLNALARSAREASARAFGSDSFALVKIASGTLSRRELAERLQRNPDITSADVRFLETAVAGRVLLAATAQRQGEVVAGGKRFENASVNGTQAALFEIRDVGIGLGRPFTRAEEQAAAQVVVIGRDIADRLFPQGSALGATVRVGNRGFRVVGVQAAQGTAGGTSLDRYVWMPLPAYERTFGSVRSLQVFARAVDVTLTTAAEDLVRTSMRARRHLSPGAPDNFDLVRPEASRGFVAQITERLGAAAPPVSIMALVAAIVVVTNTTLVSITQRTREIGLRRAVGATPGNIVIETLAESGAIALAGGVIGIAAASALLSVAARVTQAPVELEWTTIAGSVGAAIASGLVAGWYPARRAAALEVITALRQE
jgi:putative ABC transport system permease protein